MHTLIFHGTAQTYTNAYLFAAKFISYATRFQQTSTYSPNYATTGAYTSRMEHTYELSIPDSTTNSREEQSRARVLRNRVEEEGEEKQYSRGKSTGGLGGEQSKDRGKHLYIHELGRGLEAAEKIRARSQVGGKIRGRR